MNLFKKTKIYLYNLYLRKKLFSLGKNSYIHYPSKIVDYNKISIGNNTVVSEYSWLNCAGKNKNLAPTLVIDDNCYIGRMSQINAWESVIIENNVLIADRVLITDADHNYKDKSLPIIQQGDRFVGKVHIKSGAWIGINVVILPGVTIGKNAVVCPNSVVIKDVNDYDIVSGVPAKIIKQL